jgi:pyruvate/2-oxoglutarate dehydrogenase complex dihydrolipoamide acyltransferase (E2) component
MSERTIVEGATRDRDPIGPHALIRPSPDRQLLMDAFAAVRGGHPMTALLELDVTAPLAAIDGLRSSGTRVSLFAFIVRSIAVAISEHPDLNMVRHGKYLVRFEDVDVSVPVEVRTPDGNFPRETVIRRAQDVTPADIYAQLEAARARHQRTGSMSDDDRWLHRALRVIQLLPRFVRVAIVRLVMRNAFRIKARTGTTLVTSVGKFATIPGFSFTFSTGPRAAVFVVGSVVEKPWIHAGQITPRSVLSLSMLVDHDLVDGAPAARFAQRLKALIESGEGLS